VKPYSLLNVATGVSEEALSLEFELEKSAEVS